MVNTHILIKFKSLNLEFNLFLSILSNIITSLCISQRYIMFYIYPDNSNDLACLVPLQHLFVKNYNAESTNSK